MKKFITTLLLLTFLFIPQLTAQEKVNLDVVNKIRTEGFKDSHVMEILSYLSDVYGPRLTHSPNYKKAGDWAIKKLTEWGLKDAKFEKWGDFGSGWDIQRYSLEMIEPQYSNLIAMPQAWTPGTNGEVVAEPVLVKAESLEDLEQYKGKLNGKIVMMGLSDEIAQGFEPDAVRLTDKDLEELVNVDEPVRKGNYRERYAKYRAMRKLREKMRTFIKDEGAVAILEPSVRNYGTIHGGAGGSHEIGAEKVLPTLVVSAEQYNRIVRILDKEIPVKLRLNVEVKFYEDDPAGYNIVAEIPGTDPQLKDQIVMLGGHFDSWHLATGATDNSAGSAVAMEAVRILKKLGIKPRRTIRIALWDAEEEGLYGSRGYVKNHFEDPETGEKKDEYDKLSVYFNLDNGSGKIRGVYLQGNDEARPIFNEWLKPFHDLGAQTLTIKDTRGTDHLSFDAVGLPGFQFIQDRLSYSLRTHHTNMDVVDHASESDLAQAAVIMASFVYNAAMMDQRFPREARLERK